jgi:hypothetical protein
MTDLEIIIDIGIMAIAILVLYHEHELKTLKKKIEELEKEIMCHKSKLHQ